jgi:hypothetical protein
VGIACDRHFQGERRIVRYKKGGSGKEFVHPESVALVRTTESRSATRSTVERPEEDRPNG